MKLDQVIYLYDKPSYVQYSGTNRNKTRDNIHQKCTITVISNELNNFLITRKDPKHTQLLFDFPREDVICTCQKSNRMNVTDSRLNSFLVLLRKASSVARCSRSHSMIYKAFISYHVPINSYSQHIFKRCAIPKFLPNTNTFWNLLNNTNTKSFADVLTIPIPILAKVP